MSLLLLRKEWRQHRGALALLLLLGPAWSLLLYLRATLHPGGSVFTLLGPSALLLATAGAVFVAHRLIGLEYGQRTQLFLESLPLSRTRILTTKLVLGAAVLLLVLGLDVLFFWRLAVSREVVTARFLLLLWVRTSTAVLLGWSLFALASLLGRYRVPLYLLLLLGAVMLESFTDVRVFESGPLALVRQEFAFERQHLPWALLGQCWAALGVLLGLCFVMVLHRDGTLTELLSERMSHREKVFLAGVFLAVSAGITLHNEARQRQPFALSDAREVLVRGTPLQVGQGFGFSEEQAQHLAERLGRDLEALGDYLALGPLPTVAVVPSRALDAGVFQRAKLEARDGVVVRANLAARDFDLRAFEAFLFREVLIERSGGRVRREERQWLLDGFTTWWVHRDALAFLAERAAVASREGFAPRRWLLVRERQGPCLAGALAARGVQVAHERLGESGLQALLRRILAPPAQTGLWGWWHEPRLDGVLRELGGPSEPELERGWEEALARDREAHAARLASLAALRPELSRRAESDYSFRLEHVLRPPEGDSAPGYAFLYDRLAPFETEVLSDAFSRQDVAPGAGVSRLPQDLSRGDLWLFVMQVELPELGCPVRLLSRREEIR